MMKIASSALAAVREHSERGYPLEICGFLVGTLEEDVRTAHEAYPVRNSWDDDPEERALLMRSLERSGGASVEQWEAFSEERRFMVSSRDILDAQKRARAAGLDLIGVYHTHPNHPAVPSRFDLDTAMPEWSYLILSVREGRVAEERSWVVPFGEDEFGEEPIQHF